MLLIQASRQDSELLLDWRNDPETRRASFHQEAVTAERHRRWLYRVLADRERDLWIAALADGQAVGAVRLDRVAAGQAEVSLTVAPGWRERGLGKQILELAARHAFGPAGLNRLRARVRPGNLRSLALFERAGYRRVPSADASVDFVLFELDSERWRTFRCSH